MATDQAKDEANSVRMFLSAEHNCGYFSDRTAQNVVIDPEHPQQARLYDIAIARGFRRSGDFVYQPRCAGCQSCQASRIRISAFSPNRSQKRTWNANLDVQAKLAEAKFHREYFALYERYLKAKHAKAGMDDCTPEDFNRFLLSDWVGQQFLELRLAGELIALSITDVTRTGLSAVYTCYSPDYPRRSLGTLAILQQIDWCRQLNLPFLYLGFWLQGHAKMHYKSGFSGFEYLQQGRWCAS